MYLCWTELFEIEVSIRIKIDLALNNLKTLLCHKTQTNQTKLEQSDKIKRDFFQALAVYVLLYGWTTRTLAKHIEKRLDRNYARILGAVEQILVVTPNKKSSCTATCLPSHKVFMEDEQELRGTAGEERKKSCYGLPHMDAPVSADLQRLIYISSVWTQNAVKWTCQERRMIGMGGERESEREGEQRTVNANLWCILGWFLDNVYCGKI